MLTLGLVAAAPASSSSFIQQPAKLMRLTSVARAMLEEARNTPCDSAGCERFREIYERTVAELADLLSEDLQLELSYVRAALSVSSPSPSELRVAQAELVGWLEGLFSGIAASVRSHELGAREQVDAIADDLLSDSDLRPMPGQYI